MIQNLLGLVIAELVKPVSWMTDISSTVVKVKSQLQPLQVSDNIIAKILLNILANKLAINPNNPDELDMYGDLADEISAGLKNLPVQAASKPDREGAKKYLNNIFSQASVRESTSYGNAMRELKTVYHLSDVEAQGIISNALSGYIETSEKFKSLKALSQITPAVIRTLKANIRTFWKQEDVPNNILDPMLQKALIKKLNISSDDKDQIEDLAEVIGIASR